MDDMARLLEVLNEINDEVDFKEETALVDDGLIDSLDITRLIAALGETFNVRITTGDIEPENFNSVDAILALVHRHQGRP